MTVTRRIRPAIMAAVLSSTAFGGLLALEHVAPNASAPPVTVIDADLKADPSGNGSAQSGQHDKHCEDGKGKDAEKNKHCREVSGAQ